MLDAFRTLPGFSPLQYTPKRLRDRALVPAPRHYRRSVDLPRLVTLWPGEIADTSEAGRLRLLDRLRGALRSERRRGLAGHWTYDLARHHQLLAAYRAETAALLDLRRQRLWIPVPAGGGKGSDGQ